MMTSLAEAEAHAARVVRESGTSFSLGMRSMPEDGRKAMFAIYAFCREIDDIADEPGEETAKRDALAAWGEEIEALYSGAPTRPTTIALEPAVAAYALPKAEFHELIAGMLMDVDMDFGQVPPLDREGLSLYCRRVAGAVGLLSINVFGQPDAQEFACVMGDALQLTNILRDVGEDARIGRLYLPADLLARHGIPVTSPAETIRHPALPAVCMELAAEAQGCYRRTQELLSRHDARKLRPALMMSTIYQGYLDRLIADGFRDPTGKMAMPKLFKLKLVAKALMR